MCITHFLSNFSVIGIFSCGRYADRVDHYSQLSGLIELERLDTAFVTAALNSEQIFNTGRLTEENTSFDRSRLKLISW